MGTLKSQEVSSEFNPLSANPTKWSNKLKQFVGKMPTNCFSVFDHFVKLALKELRRFGRKRDQSGRLKEYLADKRDNTPRYSHED